MNTELKSDALAEVTAFINKLDDLKSFAEHLRLGIESQDVNRAMSSLNGIEDHRDGYWGAIIVRFPTEAINEMLSEIEGQKAA